MAGEVKQGAERLDAQKQMSLPATLTAGPKRRGRERLPEHLERREEIHPCCPEGCQCANSGAEGAAIGYETREELACEPATFWVRVRAARPD